MIDITVYAFELPEFLFKNSCLTKLSLYHCYFKSVGVIDWKNLKTLCIGYKWMTQDLIRNILSGSPVLETLELCCEYFRKLDINSTSLRKFVLVAYDDRDGWNSGDLPQVVIIHAPNMLSLTIKGKLLLCRVVLLDVPSLVDAHLECSERYYIETAEEVEEEMLKRIILKLQHVKELKFEGRCSEVLSRLRAKGFTCPSELKANDKPATDVVNTEILEKTKANGPETVLWHGHNVSESHVELLRVVEEQHPETFQRLRVQAERVWEAYLGEFGRVITSFLKTSFSDLTEDMVRALREDLQDLDMYGFDVSWVFEHLHKVEELGFGEPLQQVSENLCTLDKQIALLGEELSHARDRRAELVKERDDKKAFEVATRLGMDYDKLLDGSVFGLLKGYRVPL